MAECHNEKEVAFGVHDPNGISNEISVVFDDVIGEPNSALTHDTVWRFSKSSFYYGKDGLYLILSSIFGIPFSFILGMLMALFSFATIWFLRPSLKIVQMFLDSVYGCWSKLVECSCGSLFYNLGLLFSRIKYSKLENHA